MTHCQHELHVDLIHFAAAGEMPIMVIKTQELEDDEPRELCSAGEMQLTDEGGTLVSECEEEGFYYIAFPGMGDENGETFAVQHGYVCAPHLALMILRGAELVRIPES